MGTLGKTYEVIEGSANEEGPYFGVSSRAIKFDMEVEEVYWRSDGLWIATINHHDRENLVYTGSFNGEYFYETEHVDSSNGMLEPMFFKDKWVGGFKYPGDKKVRLVGPGAADIAVLVGALRITKFKDLPGDDYLIIAEEVGTSVKHFIGPWAERNGLDVHRTMGVLDKVYPEGLVLLRSRLFVSSAGGFVERVVPYGPLAEETGIDGESFYEMTDPVFLDNGTWVAMVKNDEGYRFVGTAVDPELADQRFFEYKNYVIEEKSFTQHLLKGEELVRTPILKLDLNNWLAVVQTAKGLTAADRKTWAVVGSTSIRDDYKDETFRYAPLVDENGVLAIRGRASFNFNPEQGELVAKNEWNVDDVKLSGSIAEEIGIEGTTVPVDTTYASYRMVDGRLYYRQDNVLGFSSGVYTKRKEVSPGTKTGTIFDLFSIVHSNGKVSTRPFPNNKYQGNFYSMAGSLYGIGSLQAGEYLPQRADVQLNYIDQLAESNQTAARLLLQDLLRTLGKKGNIQEKYIPCRILVPVLL